MKKAIILFLLNFWVGCLTCTLMTFNNSITIIIISTIINIIVIFINDFIINNKERKR